MARSDPVERVNVYFPSPLRHLAHHIASRRMVRIVGRFVPAWHWNCNPILLILAQVLIQV
ncbi:MAG: hypothetical protein DCC66_02440 [Planctomycetota bacterium]|nr:MAG: hypothetical protein DCC66_02440 [Planctomycetota bacterium]